MTAQKRVIWEDGTPVIFTDKGTPARWAVEGNWYEGSRWSPHRQWVWFPLQTANRDLDRFTRYELNKRGEYLVKNSPLIRGLIERLVNLVIGSGIHPIPSSSKKEWNDKAKARWRFISRRPSLGVDANMSMSVYQRVCARARFTHGECFTNLTFGERSGKAKIQGLESFRVTSQDTPDADSNQDDGTPEPTTADGIAFDQEGPVSYKVRGVKTPLPAESVVHHFTARRYEQPRGETILSAAINTAQDVDDILSLEKQAVKDASSHKDIIKTASGELDPETIRKLEFGQQYPTTIALPVDKTTRTDYYKISFGSEPIVLKRGDEYTPYKPDRPGSAWQGFMDFLSNTICLSTGLPPSLLLPVIVGGTDIRRDLEIAQRIIGPWQEDIATEWQRIWEYFMLDEIESGPLSDAPDDWTSVRWQFPRSITVDRGRDAIQDRADVQAGLMSHEEYHGRYGDDGEEYEQAVEMEVRQRRFRLLGTPITEPFKNAQEYLQILSLDYRAMQAKQPGEDGGEGDNTSDEPPPQPKKKSKALTRTA